jgi:hypothetical protein
LSVKKPKFEAKDLKKSLNLTFNKILDMHKILLLILLLGLGIKTYAVEIPSEDALQIAANFYRIQNGSAANDLSLVQQEMYNGRSILYVFQVNTDDGFVILSGDDQAYPILGYSLNGKYIFNDQAPQFSSWIDKYYNEIVWIVEHNIPQTQAIAEAWTTFRDEQTLNHALRSSVGPLVGLGWDQSPNYNAQCPFNTQYNQLTVTGCVATAMAMIMKYWNYPAQGSGFHSYSTQEYGTLSASFSNATYNWSAMPSQLTGANAEVAKLMAHCGVSVEMGYGVGQTGGSSAYVVNAESPIQHCAEYAYKTYFGYDASSVNGVVRSNYTDQNWINLLKAELDASRPMQYAGLGNGGGHTWVCDGYDDNSMFHMNWGWSNQNDGYFNLNALNPTSLGTGGGDGGFNSTQQAVIGIKPPGGSNPPAPTNVSISSFITVSPSPYIDFASAFDVYCQIRNNGSSSLTADFAAVLLTPDGYVVDFIQSFANESISGNSAVNAQFSTTGLLATPGDYSVAIIFKQGSGNWQLISAGSGFANPAAVQILGPYNTMEVYSNMTLSPTQFVSGQQASVTVNILNDGFLTWSGTYAAALFDLEGNYVATIGEYNETTGLPSGFLYNPPYLTFTSANLNVPPGSYILAMLGQEQGTSQYYLLGGTYFTNPITITVAGPPVSPDQYEANDLSSNAYTFNPTFSGSSTSVTTTGSTLHVGSDVDYYKVNLPSGYSYLINARLHDLYNSGNGNTYSVDAVFSYDSGSGLSPVVDDIAPDAIVLNGGGSITFKVSPYFTGNTGTYLLDIQISRSPLSVSTISDNIYSIYPNPTSDFVWFECQQPMGKGKLELINSLGQTIKSFNISTGAQKQLVDTKDLSSGLYFIKYTSDNNQVIEQVIIR